MRVMALSLSFVIALFLACNLKQGGSGGNPPPDADKPSQGPEGSPPPPSPSPSAENPPQDDDDDDGGTTVIPPSTPIDSSKWEYTIPSADCANCLLNRCVEQADDFLGPHFHETYDQYGQDPTRYFDSSCANYMNCLSETACPDSYGTGVSTQARTNCENACLSHPGVEPTFGDQDFAHPEACRGRRDRYDDCVETSCDEQCRKPTQNPVTPLPPPPSEDRTKCVARLKGSPLPVTVPMAGVIVTEPTTPLVGTWGGNAQLSSPKLPEPQPIGCGVPRTAWRYGTLELQDAPFPVLTSAIGPWLGPFPNPGDGVKLRVIPTQDTIVEAPPLEDLCRKRVHSVVVPRENIQASMPPGVFWNVPPAPLPAFPAGSLPQDVSYSIPDARLSLSCKTKWEVKVDYQMRYRFVDPAHGNDCGGFLTIVGAVVTKLSEQDFALSGTLTTTTAIVTEGNLVVDSPPPEITREANGVITDGVVEEQYLEYSFAWNPEDFLKAMKVTAFCPSNGYHGSAELMHPAMPVINFWGLHDKAPDAAPPVAKIRLTTKDQSTAIPTQPLFPDIISLDVTRKLSEARP